MNHYVLDGYRGVQTEFDDQNLVREAIETLSCDLGVCRTMPTYLLPYYRGVRPEDCGISAFTLLLGGHITIHTFSQRRLYFLDILSPVEFDPEKAKKILGKFFSTEEEHTDHLNRLDADGQRWQDFETDKSFGPHLFLEISEPEKMQDLDDIYTFLDSIHDPLAMHPITRPVVLRNRYQDQDVLSGLTMIAESHISVHVFPARRALYLDVFSCKPFTAKDVLAHIRNATGGKIRLKSCVARGRIFKQICEEMTRTIGDDWTQYCLSQSLSTGAESRVEKRGAAVKARK